MRKRAEIKKAVKKIVVVGPAGPLPRKELGEGLEHLTRMGFEVELMPEVLSQHLWYAGSDQARLRSFIEAAYDSEADTVLCARGGYGAARLLEGLDRVTKKRGKPPVKTLMGYSDITALHAYVNAKWGWRTVHSVMPAAKEFCHLPPRVWKAWSEYAAGGPSRLPATRLKCWSKPKRSANVSGRLIGGNLAVWQSLFGTPWQPSTRDSILFVEDTFEQPYALDRMMQRLLHSQGLKGVQAIVLGTFFRCEDKPAPAPSGPIREPLDLETALQAVFVPVAQRLGVGLWAGLPVGHGPDGIEPLELGVRVKLEGGKLLR